MKHVYLAMLVPLVAGCGGDYSQPSGGASPPSFTIDCPKGWQRRDHFQNTEVMFLSPMEGPSDQFRENLNVVIEKVPHNVSLEQYTTLATDKMKAALPGFEIVEEGNVKVGTNDGQKIRYHATVMNMAFDSDLYFVVENGRAYAITCTMLNGKRQDAHLNGFRQSVASFHAE